MTNPADTLPPPHRETGINHWRRELGQCEQAALLVDETLKALEINLPARELGIVPAQPCGAWMQALQAQARRASGATDEVCVAYVPVEFKEFRGWFVTPCGTQTGSKKRIVGALEKKLEDAKRRLAAEIRRRQFLERQILTLADGDQRAEPEESQP